MPWADKVTTIMSEHHRMHAASYSDTTPFEKPHPHVLTMPIFAESIGPAKA